MNTFEDVFVPSMLAAGGNLFGGAMNYFTNKQLQEQQLEHQKSLQDRAYAMNERAVQRQAQNQVLGMQNAGLNPAAVNGAGAPSIQAGAAAGATSQFANIFNGITELINAVKAPTEIEKLVAETGKTEAETNLAEATTGKTKSETSSLIPAQTKNFINNAAKLNEETRGIKNNNEWLEAQNNFLKDQTPALAENRIAQLKASGQWENLPERTRETLEDWAAGNFKTEIGIGEIEALNKFIDTHTKISTSDKYVLENTRDMIVAYKQITDGNITDAFAKLPINQQNLMRSQITEYYAMAKQANSQTDLNKLNKWLNEHTSDQWLIEHGMSDEIERKKYTELLNSFLKFPEKLGEGVGMGMGAGFGGSIGRGAVNTLSNGRSGPKNPIFKQFSDYD